jgi:hypothetical protein
MEKKANKIYTDADYVGELNLLKLERRIIVRELSRTQMISRSAKLLKFSERGLYLKILSHQIKKSEWKRKIN